MAYYNSLYEPIPSDRLFYFKKHYLLSEIKRVAKFAGLTPIRVHDLRHSHASLLIEMGFNILMVSQRLGHDKVEITWQTYAHLYPDKEKMLAPRLDTVKIHGIEANLLGRISCLISCSNSRATFRNSRRLSTSTMNKYSAGIRRQRKHTWLPRKNL